MSQPIRHLAPPTGVPQCIPPRAHGHTIALKHAGLPFPALGLPSLEHYARHVRPGGPGEADLWVSRRSDIYDDLGWRAPVKLGPGINTSAVEAAPYFIAGERTTLDLAQYYGRRIIVS